jgi:peptidoglycan/LPS O-acetylase OafA/YrhL
MAGVLAFCLSKRRAAVWPFWTWTLVLGAAMLAFLVLTADRAHPHIMALSWTLTLSVGLLVPNFAETNSPVIRRTCATIAKYSYGIYLTHMLTFWLVFSKLSNGNVALRLMLGIGLSVALPVIAYHLVEAPGIRLGARLAASLVSSMANVLSSSPLPEAERPLTAVQS